MAGNGARVEIGEEKLADGIINNAETSGPMPIDQNNGKMNTKKESPLKRAWTKSGLNVGFLIMMFKFSLPPTIALAIYQDPGASAIYQTLGYLPAIISVLSFCILPRSKFIQTMFLNLIGTCIGMSVALLQIYCSVQARKHTTPPPSASSQGGLSQLLPASLTTHPPARPQLQIPVIIYSIFANIASIYAPGFPTMDAGITFALRLFECFLTGLGIGTAVSLFVVPISMRVSWFGQAGAFIKSIQTALEAQVRCFQVLEREDMFEDPELDSDKATKSWNSHHKAETKHSPAAVEMQNIKRIFSGIGQSLGKLKGDLTFAKREMAWGKLNASEIDELFKLLPRILIPLMGLASFGDIFQRLAKKWGWEQNADEVNAPDSDVADKIKAQWNAVMSSLHAPVETASRDINDGLQHALLTLQLVKPPKKSKAKKGQNIEKTSEDVEANAEVIRPGDPGFGAHFAKIVEGIHDLRRSAIQALFERQGIETKSTSGIDSIRLPSEVNMQHPPESKESAMNMSLKGQLFLILYIDHLVYWMGKSVLSLVEFADSKVDSKVLAKNRLIHPSAKRLKKWATSLLQHDNSTSDHTPDSAESGATVNLKPFAGFSERKDPEHLEPTTAWQRGSNGFRLIADTLGSTASQFGFRVACATMSVAIVAYLENTRTFFLEQRLVWALIMVAISMTVTAGSGVFGFMGRIAGTFVAMLTSLAIWYIPNGHTTGVIVILWLFIFVETYFVLMYPKFVIIAILSIVTQVLIIGYELEVQQLGVQTLTLLAAIRQHSADTVWEPTVGGRFPRERYDAIVEQSQK
ncbi:uncharacterized protein KY384_001271 [Bacidia gigantensis]|uniref:uncharacterized protein n=1 Tax=Bacidia gigantensis TaxID=2732470 RepID=UPI001D03868B|nr:uncharacterized protein KY384_001271 [Bacidia gigantensis]KAG8533531.1 hypothetical protein KY384_001271 [Bacidia gigantensis]